MNFATIFHGMIGRDFIKAFNDNFVIADETFLSILAQLIYKVKSTDIKEFKVIDNVVSYTLEEAPEEGEDTRTWTPVDITAWGNITGNIEDQTDLWNILEDKAAVDTVATINNLLSTLSTDFNTLKNKVENDEVILRTNTNDIADMLVAMTEKVNSTNIKAIRLNNAVFQWSPDGRTWYEQPIVTSIAWGHVTGDITTQTDLMAYFTEIDRQIGVINGYITDINNAITNLQAGLSNLEAALDSHISDFNEYKDEIDDDISAIRGIADDSDVHATQVENALNQHIADQNNPHRVTKATIFLDNVDNTADINKPLSGPQKQYVDDQIRNVTAEISDKEKLVASDGHVATLFVGDATTYNNIGAKHGMLAVILDDAYFYANLTLTSTNYPTYGLYKDNVLVTPTSEITGAKSYENIPLSQSIYTIKVEVSGVDEIFPITINYATDKTISIDDLVEGGNS